MQVRATSNRTAKSQTKKIVTALQQQMISRAKHLIKAEPFILSQKTMLTYVLAEKDQLPMKAVTMKTQPCVAAPEKVLLEEDWEM